MSVRVAAGAEVDERATIGDGSTIWHLAQIRENAQLGRNCVVGRGAYIGPGVCIGDNVKIQNLALVYDPAQIGNGVFIGPAAVLTNDVYPRSVDIAGCSKNASHWESLGVTVDEGASIGARSVVLAGVSIGAWALIGAGAVVVRDVPAHALFVGNPACQKGWVGRFGVQLQHEGKSHWRCPETGEIYLESSDKLTLVSS